MKTIVLLLAHTNNEHVNCTVSPRDLRTPLHFSCAIGNLSITQLLIWVSFETELLQLNLEIILFLSSLTQISSKQITKDEPA